MHSTLRIIGALVLFVVALTGADRQMLRGYAIGRVLSVNVDEGRVSVDIGSNDYVLRGVQFSVVDESGREVAKLSTRQVYPELFWSDKLPAEITAKIRPGYSVRWVFTPETTALLYARKVDSVGVYREFIKEYPGSTLMAELLNSLQDDTLKELNPDYYEAWKRYTVDDLQSVADRYPGTSFAIAAAREIASIKSFDADQEKERAEREKRAAVEAAEQKRRQSVEEKAREVRDKTARSLLGKIRNNSGQSVRFAFDEPDDLAPVTLQPNSVFEVRHSAGTFGYKVFKADDGQAFAVFPPPQALPGVQSGDVAKNSPLKEGTVDVQFDFWEISYP